MMCRFFAEFSCILMSNKIDATFLQKVTSSLSHSSLSSSLSLQISTQHSGATGLVKVSWYVLGDESV